MLLCKQKANETSIRYRLLAEFCPKMLTQPEFIMSRTSGRTQAQMNHNMHFSTSVSFIRLKPMEIVEFEAKYMTHSISNTLMLSLINFS